METISTRTNAKTLTNQQPTAQKAESSTQPKPDKLEQIRRKKKSLEQELAEIDAKRQKIMAKYRKAETRKKIIFGATMISMIEELNKIKNDNGKQILKLLKKYIEEKKPKAEDIAILNEIINELE